MSGQDEGTPGRKRRGQPEPQSPSIASSGGSRLTRSSAKQKDVGTPDSKTSRTSRSSARKSPRISQRGETEKDEDSGGLQKLPADIDDSESSPMKGSPPPDSDSNLNLELEEEGGTPVKLREKRKMTATSPGSETMRSMDGSMTDSRRSKSPGTQGRHAEARFRPDIGSTAKHHKSISINPDQQHSLDPEGVPPSASNTTSVGGDVEQGRDGPKVYIWGTKISVYDVKRSFRKFLEGFKALDPDEDEVIIRQEDREREVDPDESYYIQRYKEIAFTEEPYLNVNLQHVKAFDNSTQGRDKDYEPLYKKILCYPADIIPYLDMVANELFYERHGDVDLPHQLEIRPFNADKTRNMRGLNPEDMDQLITVSGMVIRTSTLIPEMRQGFFQCSICKNHVEVEVDRGRIEEPSMCSRCNTSHSFRLIHNRSLFMDKQIVKLQESPDDMPAGQTPHTITLFCHGNLVDTVQPGDRVSVTGIFRGQPLRVNPKMRTVRAVYKTNIDVVHFRMVDDHRLHQENDGSSLTQLRRDKIIELSQKPDVYERLAHALAPSIYEHEDVKKGILCLLFGGTNKDLTGAGRGKFRSEINVLLCGDPGTSKSQLLQYVHNLVPRGQYTSGKGSSAVGLTAYVTRDPDTKHFVLQTGALVLSDNGVCCIDEFDKMNDGTRSVLHEVMEQQTLSIAKAGIICQLNARTSILAAANPVDSQWNKDKTIVENVQLPHTLLSRFDLIFLLVDPQNEMYDRRLAAHLVSLYYRTEEEKGLENTDMSLIRDYIGYAKGNIHPKLTEGASQELIEKYLEMRKVGSGRGQVSAYPRQLESLIRLAEAHAKIRLSHTVEVADVEESYRLHREALKQSAVDPLTGRVDVNILAAGISSTTRKHITELVEVIKHKMGEKKFGFAFDLKTLLRDLRDTSDRQIGRELFEEAVNDLLKNDVISKTGDKIRLLSPIEFMTAH